MLMTLKSNKIHEVMDKLDLLTFLSITDAKKIHTSHLIIQNILQPYGTLKEREQL